MAALWGTGRATFPVNGQIIYRRTEDLINFSSYAFNQIQADIYKLEDMQTFEISEVFIATFLYVENPLDKNQINHYQVVIVQGIESEKTVVIFNYLRLDWLPEKFHVGIFAASENEECHKFLRPNGNLKTSSNFGEPGKWVMVVGKDLECDHFRSECSERVEGTLPGRMSLRGYAWPPMEWLFYMEDCQKDRCVGRYTNQGRGKIDSRGS